MSRNGLDKGVLELIIHGIFPNATIPALGRLGDIIHDLALDWDAFGKWFNDQIRIRKISLQEVDIVGVTFEFIAYDFSTYMLEQFQLKLPGFEIYYDDEDTHFSNWTEIINWLSELKEKNPIAWKDSFVQCMCAFDNKRVNFT